jgi:hypothetical protein
MVNVLKNSILKNVTTLIHGPIMLFNSDNTQLTFKKLNNISPFIYLLGVRLNHKIYSKNQIKNLKKASYVANVSILYNSIKILIKMPYSKFRHK